MTNAEMLSAPLGSNTPVLVPKPQKRWSDSVALSMIISLLVGLLYTVLFMGPRVLNPRDIDWLTPDPVAHYAGWELFRHDPQWHWPLSYTTYIGYPVGEAAALMDFNSLIAVPLKVLSPFLPEPFQYFGFEIVLCCGLQFFFAWRLLRLLVGSNVLGVLLASTFFLISPPLTYRLVGHYSLSNHWVLLAALLLFFQLQFAPDATFRRFAIWSLVLSAAVVAINPYLAFQVLLVLLATVLSLLWQQRLTLSKAFEFTVLLGGMCVLVAYCIGFFIPGGRGYQSSGYRYYSMNLLAPFDSMGWGWLFPKLPQLTRGQYEGYNYLGAGVILLTVMVVAYLMLVRDKLNSPDKRWVLPLALCCLVLTLMSFSTKVSMGAHVVTDLDPHEKLTRFAAPLRASGRLFWLPYYTLLTSLLAIPLVLLRKSAANGLLVALLLFQATDTAPLRRLVHLEINKGFHSPLRSPIWSQLRSFHENLVVLPAWQCDNSGSPGGIPGYEIFGMLAAAQKMRTNSYDSARYTEVSREFHCQKAIADLSMRPLSPDSAYVVTPALAEVIALGPTGPGKCHDLDGFILCSVKSDFGLSARLKTTSERLHDSLIDPGFEDSNLVEWPSFLAVKVAVATDRARTGLHSLAQTDGDGSVYQDIKGLEPRKWYLVSAWVSASPGATSTAQIALWDPGTNVSTESPPFHPSTEWQLLTHSMAASSSGTLRLHLFRRGGTGSIYWDDVSVSVLR
jgi:hypothetical protein